MTLRRLLSIYVVWLLSSTPLRADASTLHRPDTQPPDQMIRVIVHLAGQRALTERAQQAPASGLIAALRREADTLQAPLRAWLQSQADAGRVADVTPFWIFNGLAVTATPEVIRALAQRPDVERVALDAVILAPHRRSALPGPPPVGANLSVIGAPEAWARGITGKGVVVAVLDSGVDMSHPELAARWRGGTNSWFDPHGEYPDEPFDVDGHGTQVLGVILGGDASGSHIGVAPDAQWIAARIFNNRNRTSLTAIHQALEWVLDPDGDPATDDTPDVVNNSWSFVNRECDREFADDLRALRAAGILPVFAAGVNRTASPANTPEALAVGALAAADQIAFDSPHGPSACDKTTIFPQIVAPGEDIVTTDRFGLYVTLSGTSLAAAHVSGALALVLSAKPGLSAEDQAAIMTETAVDLGEPGPDNVFGYGRLNVAAALDRVLGPDQARQPTPVPPVQPGGGPPAALIIGLGVLALLIGLGIMWRRRSSGKTGNA
jgi:subtilisin family serine protease